MTSKPILKAVSCSEYIGEHHTMKREYGTTPNGNPIGGQWVLRKDGQWVDFNCYRLDLAEQEGIILDDYNAKQVKGAEGEFECLES